MVSGAVKKGKRLVWNALRKEQVQKVDARGSRARAIALYYNMNMKQERNGMPTDRPAKNKSMTRGLTQALLEFVRLRS